MFLAGKVEETPRPLKDVIIVSYEIIHMKNPGAAQRIKQKEVYEQQKELILLGERVVLATLAFDLNIHHPYKPLVEAIKKFKVAQNALAQVAWNFVNDGLRTSLCLQFKPHHIAAGAIFLAAKFLKVKLPSDGEKVWWQEFDVTPRQLEEVSNQMLELYEQNRVPVAQGSEVDGSTAGGPSHPNVAKATATTEEQTSKPMSSCSAPEHSYGDNHGVTQRAAQNLGKNNGTATDGGSTITGYKVDPELTDSHHTPEMPYKDNGNDISDITRSVVEHVGVEKERNTSKSETVEAGEWRDDGVSHKSSIMVSRNVEVREGPIGQSPKEAIKMIDRDKVKAALEKRRKSRGEISRKKDVMDEDDLIERELEDGIELAAEDEKNRRSKVFDNQDDGKVREESSSVHHAGTKNHTSWGAKTESVVEEGEMLDDASPALNSRKRKAGRSPDWHTEGKKWNDPMSNNHHHALDDGNCKNRSIYSDRELKRHAHENHL
ncbi:cyclin-T1-5 isoform X2 [Cucumis melo]|nr:cyclin-T1-5 isoform X2 [Cucumis melo]XP_050936582.1 cyclin-T1-5 isoform X2 [Cucumis melo]